VRGCLEVFPLLPPMGNLTLVVAVLSYAGDLNLTAAADLDSCADVEVFAHGVRGALDDLERSVLGLDTSGQAGAHTRAVCRRNIDRRRPMSGS
jgi:hypothetical protein